ncbi:GntR family transcriptional regulator [Parapedobacter sp. ISTM3]|uniref:GntR family transcriptional regulator n=1 Tax=Parapedobacter sp. ISTM3 TaxID=2800130 RepID=UPI001903D30D|nr:GntR family transcriptional regulator [Parapedobacter sp. ISTM3]MBK1441409.1 GntR family transcriptional regulator [Parapedobacter sp. ISTM3]
MKNSEVSTVNSELKYLKLAHLLLDKIKQGDLRINDQLPSVNRLAAEHNISKSTVLMALNHLMEKGIIEPVYRKGFFVKKNSIDHQFRVFFLLDKLTVFKEELYHSFFNRLKDHAHIDVFFHNYSYRIFERLVLENLGNYTHYVILSIMKEDVSPIINLIPPEKRIILDYNIENLNGDYSAVYQDFAGDIYAAMKDVRGRVEKYRRAVLVLPEDSFYGNLVKDGFLRFCEEYQFDYLIVHQIERSQFRRGDVYITLNRHDRDDVDIIKLVREHKYKLGRDIGLISYNDLYVKEVLEGGITVISTDFSKMGEEAANLILEGKVAKIKNPSKLIIRPSL